MRAVVRGSARGRRRRSWSAHRARRRRARRGRGWCGSRRACCTRGASSTRCRAWPTPSRRASRCRWAASTSTCCRGPNEVGAIPTTNVSRDEAARLCEGKGKRLCSELEWERACKGPDNARYEYGATFDARVCDAGQPADTAARHPSGERTACRSAFGVREMHGGAWEWTDSPWNRGAASHPETPLGVAAGRQRSRRRAGHALRFRPAHGARRRDRRPPASAAAAARATTPRCAWR